MNIINDYIYKMKRDGKSDDEIINFALKNFRANITGRDINDIIKSSKEFDNEFKRDAIVKKEKILLFDIETAPNLGWVWGKWEQNVIDYEKEMYILCYAAKWFEDGKTFVRALPDFKEYKKDKENDLFLVQELWALIDEADIVIGQNSDAFDIKKVNSRFLYHGLTPPSTYATIDTVKLARKYFSFNSNKLDDLGKHLGLGEKVETGGFKLWKGCMDGDKKSWDLMKKYNKTDVDLLEKIYLKFRPWHKNGPNIGMFREGLVCPKCGSNNLQSRGVSVNKTTKYRRLQCQNCGGWSRTTKNIGDNKPIISV